MHGGAAGHYLLGLVCRKTNRSAPAIAHFRTALAADPFCWSAFEELCALGDDKEAAALLNDAKCVFKLGRAPRRAAARPG